MDQDDVTRGTRATRSSIKTEQGKGREVHQSSEKEREKQITDAFSF